ncbi:IS110 family transposase [Vibrio sp.]|uniref:IS110 family transposase n=1 Tax=Vibrio sp. TaxID=678 RepID=UPI003D0BC298
MSLYCGIDLHANNNYIGISDENNRRVHSKKLRNNLEEILRELEPYKKELESVVVESTFNWYWLVDGLMKYGYNVQLANPSAMSQYTGLKYTDDVSDSFWLAYMDRLGILPTGYIYPREQRSVRDLLRRRFLFVKQRTAHILSLKSMIARECGYNIDTNDLKKLQVYELENMFENKYLCMIAESNLSIIHHLGRIIDMMEKEVRSQCRLHDSFKMLLTVPGIGDILAMMIMLEVGDIRRFPAVGNFCSYSRCVQSIKISNNKKKGENNRKNGNKYLSWAFIEAANYAIRYSPEARRFYQRKMARTNNIVARKALANKLARASYYIMRDGVKFDKEKLFS